MTYRQLLDAIAEAQERHSRLRYLQGISTAKSTPEEIDNLDALINSAQKKLDEEIQ